MTTRTQTLGVILSAAFAACVLPSHDAEAQPQRAAAPRPPAATPRAGAPIDVTGNWVSLVTDDWVYRMITLGQFGKRRVSMPAERMQAGLFDLRDDLGGGVGR